VGSPANAQNDTGWDCPGCKRAPITATP
jgi:hypothetical protein